MWCCNRTCNVCNCTSNGWTCSHGNITFMVVSSLVPRPKQPQRGSLTVSRAGKEGLGIWLGVTRIFGMSKIHIFVMSFLLRFIKPKKLSPRGNCSFVTSVCCCMVRPVYGPMSLFHLQKRYLTAEIIGFFIVIQKAPAASNFILTKSKNTDCRLLLWF